MASGRQTFGVVFNDPLTEQEKVMLSSEQFRYMRDVRFKNLHSGGTRVLFSGQVKRSDQWWDRTFVLAIGRTPDLVLRDGVVHMADLERRVVSRVTMSNPSTDAG